MVLPYANIHENRIQLHNIRDCVYRSEDDYDVRHFNRQVFLDDVQTVDFIMVPFKDAPALAHTMLSFGLRDGQHLVFSAEARLEQDEDYAAVAGATKQYELIYVVGTEEDLIKLRTDVRIVDVYLYPLNIDVSTTQRLFLAAVARVNQIARTPEFYQLLSNNCTTNIVDLVNQVHPHAIAEDLRILLPGQSDRLVYDQGWMAATGPFEEVRLASRINIKAQLYDGQGNFSRAIRSHSELQ
ncbi:MAG: DUF4105 domain-containing protein [Planctomycetales bacterium]|nr:DUF4105 domain-containing protein [Planctomycetales bacterium]